MPSPFKLFDPYTASDKEVFFGRDAEIYALYNLLQQTRLVLIYGASGTGKTSVIQAGLPKVFKLTDWFRISVRWRDNINVSLRNELSKLMEDSVNITSLGEAITEIYEDRWIPIYLFFDQFEEVFTLGSHEERLTFFQDIQQLLEKPLPCKIIFSMREEYIGHLYEYEYIVPSLFDKRFRIEAMKDGTVHTVLDEMVHEFTKERARKAIVQKIFEQLKEGKQAVHLPYLQVYLHYLYEYSAQASIPIYFTGTGIKAIGKLGNVIKRFIETISNEAQTQFSQWGLPNTFSVDLLDEFATVEGTKQAGKVAELANKLATNENIILNALQYFTERKLLRADENDVHRYEPVHDVVAMQIHELRSVENKDFKAFLRQLQNDYERWKSEDKSHTRLLVESDIAKADIYQERLKKRTEFAIWKDYIEQSRVFNNHKLEEERRKNDDLKKALSKSKRNFKIAIFTAVVAILLGGLSFLFFNLAKQNENSLEKTLNQVKQEQAKNEQIIDAFYFYRDSLALAVKRDEMGKYKYGFINKEGRGIIEYKYDDALLFNSRDGFSRVKVNDIEYLLDPEGKEYKLWDDLSKLDTSATALDLSGKHLKKIPNTIFKNNNLQVLLLYDNQIENIQKDIYNLKNLKTLSLNYNSRIKNFPSVFWGMKSLRNLHLRGISIDSLPKGIAKLKNLQRLDLKGNTLTFIPNEIGDLGSLQKLYIQETNIFKLPKELGKLKRIEHLDLIDNRKLIKLPEEIGKLTNLYHFHLSGSKIKEFPVRIDSLLKIKYLVFINNKELEKFPTEIWHLRSLEIFKLINSRINNIPKDIINLKNLKHLSLSGNLQLKTIPKEIWELHKLEELDLRNVSINIVPMEVGDLSKLKKLILINNKKITSISKAIGNLNSLKELFLSGTLIEKMPSEIGKLGLLKVLYLSFNANLIEIPKEIGNLNGLERLELAYNDKLKTLPKEIVNLKNLQFLNLKGCPISEEEKKKIKSWLPNCKIEF